MRWATLLLASLSGCCAPHPALQPPTTSFLPFDTAIDPIAGADRWMPACGDRLAAAASIGEARMEAWRQRDIIRLNCVEDKSQQTEANLAVMESRIERARSAADEAELRHELTAVRIVCEKIAVLTREAASCVAEDIEYVGLVESLAL
jgi:hypothetical protein